MHSARPSRAVKVLIERGRNRVSHKSYAIESQTTTQRGFSRAHSVSKSIAKTARTRGRLFCFTFETVFYKFARLVSRTSANVMMRIDRVVFFASKGERRFFFLRNVVKCMFFLNRSAQRMRLLLQLFDLNACFSLLFVCLCLYCVRARACVFPSFLLSFHLLCVLRYFTLTSSSPVKAFCSYLRLRDRVIM